MKYVGLFSRKFPFLYNYFDKNKKRAPKRNSLISKEVAKNCGIASRSNFTYLPFLSLILVNCVSNYEANVKSNF